MMKRKKRGGLRSSESALHVVASAAISLVGNDERNTGRRVRRISP
ncbi:hypothetical protein SLEP1_g57748 [Rubroshorea leprosula]|uniref:Uncharacterized protein n=1 Tax=Rubroshorea leprosula TaxID=152421 RepID=A0AAV5MMG4_9ROSI|nr:hypothetical protein SLEP1_g57748 [Rubroshorea leprosula]